MYLYAQLIQSFNGGRQQQSRANLGCKFLEPNQTDSMLYVVHEVISVLEQSAETSQHLLYFVLVKCNIYFGPLKFGQIAKMRQEKPWSVFLPSEHQPVYSFANESRCNVCKLPAFFNGTPKGVMVKMYNSGTIGHCIFVRP